MPSNPRPRRRRTTTRRLPPRPNLPGAAEAPVAEEAVTAPRPTTARSSRSSRLIARQTPFVVSELKRVAGVSAATFGLLALLVVVDRLQ